MFSKENKKKHNKKAKKGTTKMNKTEKKESKLRKMLSDPVVRAAKRFGSYLTAFKERLSGARYISEESAQNIISIAKCLGLCAAGFLFGICEIDTMVYPLGLILLLSSGRLSFFAYAGSAVAALTYSKLGFAFFGINTLIYIIRKILLSDNFCEKLRARVILSVLTGMFISFILMMSASAGSMQDTVRSQLMRSCAIYLLGLPLGTFLLYPVTASESFGKSRVKIALCFFCMCLVTSCGSLPAPFNISAYFFACASTLFFCTLFGGKTGITAGALFGLCTFNYAFCAPLCIGASVFLMTYEKRQILAYPAFAVSTGMLYALTAGSHSHMGTTLLMCLAATALYMPAGLIICAKKELSMLEEPPGRDTVSEAYTRRMSNLSRAFGSVSKLCFGFSNRMRFPTNDEALALISVCSSKVCSNCPEFTGCRKKQLWCDGKIAEALVGGKLTPSKLPGRLGELCRNSALAADRINAEYQKLLSERFNNNKTEILAYEYATLARILKYTSRVSSEDIYFDAKITKLADAATRKFGLKNTGVTVYGSRKKVLDITGVPVSCISSPSEEIAAFYSAECGELFDSPEFIFDEGSTFTVRMTSKETITAEYVKASHTKNGETVNGDTISFFRSDDSYFYALIADGMGSGRDAAMTSKLTSVFVEKLLSGGAGKGVTLELLNNLLMSKSKECFSSVDLLELDLLKRRVSFVKAGAAPAYVLRSTKLFKVSSDTPPCGIIEGFCAENTSFEVFPGDMIIMLSDGITSSVDCGTALCEIMNDADKSSFEALAGRILDMAMSMSVHDDDMSCVIVKIK